MVCYMIQQSHFFTASKSECLPYTDALVNSAEGLEDEQAGIFNEVLKAGHKEKIIHQYL